MNVLALMKMAGGKKAQTGGLEMDEDYFSDKSDDDLPDLDEDTDLPDLDDKEFFGDDDSDEKIKRQLKRAMTDSEQYSMSGGALSKTSESGSDIDFIPFSTSDSGSSFKSSSKRNRF
jgi:hypothetical protein